VVWTALPLSVCAWLRHFAQTFNNKSAAVGGVMRKKYE
jgi:hypothetical protein